MRALCVRLGMLTLVAALAGGMSGYFLRWDLPDVRALEEYRPPTMSRMLAADGSEVADFASEKRIVLDASQIPASFRQALIASEDSRFMSHNGIDARGVVRALVTDLRQRRASQGASTLTMQLAGSLLLDRSQKTPLRKAQEAFLALEFERQYSKEEILTLYANHVHMGHGLFGLGAAARHYFAKPARELTLAESAVLVGLLPRPADYSPFRNPERATARRNLVLRRMVETGVIQADTAAALAREPIVLAEPQGTADLAPHFTEAVRRQVQDTYGGEALYGGGLQVRSTLDPRLQQSANAAVLTGLEQLARRRAPSEPGAPTPPAEAALVAIDPATGEVLAMVGGVDFGHSQFNRATQARRQSGSAFKPLVFAAALAAGRTPADVVLDEPTVFLDRRRDLPYRPENFTRRYYGSITLRQALEESSNIVAVKLLLQVGYDDTIATARRLGIAGRLQPYPSLALGAFEVTLLELTAAYGAFANQGIWVEPHWIESVADRSGRILQRAQPRVRDAVSPQVAYLMNQMLSGVVDRGTASAAASLGRTLAGKTGTTDGYTDAWFIGYTPRLVVGVWVGLDERRSLGESETGAKAALPIWTEFMRQALADSPDESFPVPPGIQFVTIDRHTGLRAEADCEHPLNEAFIATTEPVEVCTAAHHRLLQLPYPFQRYPLDRDGSLMIPREDLARLLAQEPAVYLLPDQGVLQTRSPRGLLSLEVQLLDTGAADAERELPEHFRPAEWVGVDGRPAVRVWTRN